MKNWRNHFVTLQTSRDIYFKLWTISKKPSVELLTFLTLQLYARVQTTHIPHRSPQTGETILAWKKKAELDLTRVLNRVGSSLIYGPLA